MHEREKNYGESEKGKGKRPKNKLVPAEEEWERQPHNSQNRNLRINSINLFTSQSLKNGSNQR